jgi:hypothetical protein
MYPYTHYREPPLSGVSYFLWLMPLLLAMLGLFLFVFHAIYCVNEFLRKNWQVALLLPVLVFSCHMLIDGVLFPLVLFVINREQKGVAGEFLLLYYENIDAANFVLFLLITSVYLAFRLRLRQISHPKGSSPLSKS